MISLDEGQHTSIHIHVYHIHSHNSQDVSNLTISMILTSEDEKLVQY